MADREFLEKTREWQQERMVEKIAAVVEGLRRTALTIERELVRHLTDETFQQLIMESPGESSVFIHLVYEVHHGITWMIPNMSLDDLPRRAVELDETLAQLRALDPPDDGDNELEQAAFVGQVIGCYDCEEKFVDLDELAKHEIATGHGDPDEVIDLVLDDWRSGRAYRDNNGNYHVRREGKPTGPIASWNRAAKDRFSSVEALHTAAHAGEEGS